MTLINDDNSFSAIALPNEAQISPIQGIAIDDFDNDGQVDLFVAGNMYNREVETTRSDAGTGCLISLGSREEFMVKSNQKTGVIANNNGPLQLYSY